MGKLGNRRSRCQVRERLEEKLSPWEVRDKLFWVIRGPLLPSPTQESQEGAYSPSLLCSPFRFLITVSPKALRRPLLRPLCYPHGAFPPPVNLLMEPSPSQERLLGVFSRICLEKRSFFWVSIFSLFCPSPHHFPEKSETKWSHSVMCDSLQPHEL